MGFCNICCPIYVVNEKFFSCVKKAISSLSDVVHSEYHKGVHVFIHGYVSDDKWKKEILEYDDDKIHVQINEENYGKPYVINQIVENNPSTYVLSFDHDMEVPELYRNKFIKRMVDVFEKSRESGIKVGFLANDLLTKNIHLKSAYTNEKVFNINKKEEKISFGTNANGYNDVAGSSVLFLREEFLGVDGYRQYNLFDGDGFLRTDLRRKYNTINAIIKSIPIYHNHPDDIKYLEWKVHNAKYPKLDFRKKHNAEELIKLKSYGS